MDVARAQWVAASRRPASVPRPRGARDRGITAHHPFAPRHPSHPHAGAPRNASAGAAAASRHGSSSRRRERPFRATAACHAATVGSRRARWWPPALMRARAAHHRGVSSASPRCRARRPSGSTDTLHPSGSAPAGGGDLNRAGFVSRRVDAVGGLVRLHERVDQREARWSSRLHGERRPRHARSRRPLDPASPGR